MTYLGTFGRRGALPRIALVQLLCGVLLFAAGGCGAASESTDDGLRGDVCRSDRDCTSGQVCRDGYCSVQTGTTRPLLFRFSPPNSSAFLPQLARNVTASTGESLDFALESSVVVSGQVSFQDSAQGPSGSLIFNRTDAKDAIFDREITLNNGNFTAFVLPGRYNLSMVPSDSSIPTKVWTGREFRNDTKVETLTVPTLPSENKRFVRIQGNVRFEPGVEGSTGQKQPVGGARVYAISTDGTHVTSSDVTDEDGFFAIRAIPDSGDYRFHIEASNESILIPNVVADESFTVEQEPISKEEVSLGRFPANGLQVRLQLRAPPELGERMIPWSGTDVIAEADIGRGKLVRRFDVSSDGAIVGRYNADGARAKRPTLLPAAYKFWVLPPLNSPLASVSLDLDLGSSTGPELPRLQKREFIDGRILDHSGSPVDGAEIRLLPAGERDRRFKTGAPVTTTTRSDGSFELWLDDASYVGVVSPPRSSGLPRRVIEIPAEMIESGDMLEWRLAEPMYVRGVLLGRDSNNSTKPVANTVLDARVRVGGQSLVVGEAESNESGEFGMVLPAKR